MIMEDKSRTASVVFGFEFDGTLAYEVFTRPLESINFINFSIQFLLQYILQLSMVMQKKKFQEVVNCFIEGKMHLKSFFFFMN